MRGRAGASHCNATPEPRRTPQRGPCTLTGHLIDSTVRSSSCKTDIRPSSRRPRIGGSAGSRKYRESIARNGPRRRCWRASRSRCKKRWNSTDAIRSPVTDLTLRRGPSYAAGHEPIGRPGRQLPADVRGVARAQALVDAVGDVPVRRAEPGRGRLHHRLRPAGGGGYRPAQARPLVQPPQVGDPLRGGRHDPAARAGYRPDPRVRVRHARRLQGAQGPEPGHRPDAGGAADGPARRGCPGTGRGSGTPGAHLPPLAHRAPVADQRRRLAGRGAACLPRRAGRRPGRGHRARLHAPA